jgi:hypothetical protein
MEERPKYTLRRIYRVKSGEALQALFRGKYVGLVKFLRCKAQNHFAIVTSPFSLYGVKTRRSSGRSVLEDIWHYIENSNLQSETLRRKTETGVCSPLGVWFYAVKFLTAGAREVVSQARSNTITTINPSLTGYRVTGRERDGTCGLFEIGGSTCLSH